MRNDDLQDSKAELASQNAPEILKFPREDWNLLRTLDGLQQKAGVPKAKLAMLVLKEIVDNGLDEGANVDFSTIKGGYAVQDNGRGIGGTPEEIAALFSIARPMISTKLLRLPRRGALGNGLRVVAGAVLASRGSLVVCTRNRRLTLQPKPDGSTTVVSVEKTRFRVGTRIEITFGKALPCDETTDHWATIACRLAGH